MRSYHQQNVNIFPVKHPPHPPVPTLIILTCLPALDALHLPRQLPCSEGAHRCQVQRSPAEPRQGLQVWRDQQVPGIPQEVPPG